MNLNSAILHIPVLGVQWLSGRVLDSRPRGRGLEPHRRHCVVSLSKSINPSLVLVQPRKTRLFITERLLMGRKESNRTKKNNPVLILSLGFCLPLRLEKHGFTRFSWPFLIRSFHACKYPGQAKYFE